MSMELIIPWMIWTKFLTGQQEPNVLMNVNRCVLLLKIAHILHSIKPQAGVTQSME